MITYVVIFIIFVFAIVLIVDYLNKKKRTEEKIITNYEKKQYLFDANSEFILYKVLFELFGDKYFIFPQINYNHLIQPKKSNWKDERRYRSRIDRKSADFVFCDKERIVPQLIIELDGSVHNFKSKQSRDQFIDELTGIIDLPILHIKTSNVDRDFIKSEISKKLGL